MVLALTENSKSSWHSPLNTIQTRGDPARGDFERFNIKAHSTNNCLATITVNVNWGFRCNHILTGMFSQNFDFSYFKIKQKSLAGAVGSLDCFMVFFYTSH